MYICSYIEYINFIKKKLNLSEVKKKIEAMKPGYYNQTIKTSIYLHIYSFSHTSIHHFKLNNSF